MIIVYYRDAEGKIVHHHKASEEMTLPEIETLRGNTIASKRMEELLISLMRRKAI